MKKTLFLSFFVASSFASVDINSASKEELMTIKKIGSKKADSIIEYRKKKCFESVLELKEVNGFGVQTIEALSKELEAKPCKK